MKLATTPANRTVLLKDDGTWEYVEAEGFALEKLRKVRPSDKVVAMFGELFRSMGLEVIDTGETLTCIHEGARVRFEEGIDESAVDFSLRIHSYQIDRLIQNIEAGYEDPLGRFRLIREFFGMSPRGRKGLLNNPVVTNSAFRKLIDAKNLLHIYLLSPDPDEECDATFTLFFVNGGWNIATGLSGEPERTFRLTVEDAFEVYRNVFTGGVGDIARLAKWYTGWREKVEVAAA